MQTFEVLKTIIIDGKEVSGGTVELPDERARLLLRRGYIKAAEPETTKELKGNKVTK
ncbi:MAG: hypothetical protein NXI00_20035 [Cytophagales bacterium]|nr:hypothetical protein [Cytophagales bacterium]